MRLQHIIAASDESDAGRQSVRTALDLVSRSGGRVTVVRVEATSPATIGELAESGSSETGDDHPAVARLRRWLTADVLRPDETGQVQLSVTFGIPGIEICRSAERLAADLLVLGRKHHSPRSRLL